MRLIERSTHPGSQASPATATRKAITPLLTAHLAALLFSPDALEYNAHGRPKSVSALDEAAAYDARVAALAAYIDDAQLVGRVANRARLRLGSSLREHGLMDPAHLDDVRAVHWRLLHGLANVKFRPYSILPDATAQQEYHARMGMRDINTLVI